MLMQNFGGQTKSILLFLKVAYEHGVLSPHISLHAKTEAKGVQSCKVIHDNTLKCRLEVFEADEARKQKNINQKPITILTTDKTLRMAEAMRVAREG